MSASEEYVLEGIAATTGPLTGRPFRLGLKTLEGIRDGLLNGAIDFGLDHDTNTLVPARLLEAVIEIDETGEHALRVRWALSAEAAESIGDRSGISITITDREIDGWTDPPSPDIAVSPECYFWTDREITDALQSASSEDLAVGGSRLVQLADEPPAKIIIDLLADPLMPALAAAAAVEAFKKLFESLRKKPERLNTKLHVDVRRDSRVIVLETADPKSAEAMTKDIMRAIEKLGAPIDDGRQLESGAVDASE